MKCMVQEPGHDSMDDCSCKNRSDDSHHFSKTNQGWACHLQLIQHSSSINDQEGLTRIQSMQQLCGIVFGNRLELFHMMRTCHKRNVDTVRPVLAYIPVQNSIRTGVLVQDHPQGPLCPRWPCQRVVPPMILPIRQYDLPSFSSDYYPPLAPQRRVKPAA